MTSTRRLPQAFEDDWQQSRAALVNWIDRGCREAPAYRRVVEMVDYQRTDRRTA